MATVTPGHPSAENRNALDWREGLVAYGCQLLVCVVQAASPPQLIQSLTGHRLRVACVKFAGRPAQARDDGEGAPLLLASADTSGHVILWDVQRGAALSQLPPPAGPAGKPSASLCLHWLSSQPNHLLCAHASGAVLLWHLTHAGRAATMLWRCDLPEPPTLLTVDPRPSGTGRFALHTSRGSLQQHSLSPAAPPRPVGAACSLAPHATANALQLEYSPHHPQQVSPPPTLCVKTRPLHIQTGQQPGSRSKENSQGVQTGGGGSGLAFCTRRTILSR
jgi:hypothetical protein